MPIFTTPSRSGIPFGVASINADIGYSPGTYLDESPEKIKEKSKKKDVKNKTESQKISSKRKIKLILDKSIKQDITNEVEDEKFKDETVVKRQKKWLKFLNGKK